jgi:site-specific DNA-adenine methylase
MNLKTTIKAMPIAIEKYISIFTLGSSVAFATKYTNKATIKKVGLSLIGSIQNYCTNKSG